MACFLLAVVGSAAAEPAKQNYDRTPAELLDDARDLFRAEEYEKASPLLSYLLYPEPKLAKANELAEAYTLLGLSWFALGNTTGASQELENALYQNPDLELSASYFSESFRSYFTEVKARVKDRQRHAEEIRELGKERDILKQQLDSLVVVERRPYFVNFVPFGAGQFQNGHDGKGMILFGTQAVLGGTSLGIFSYHALKYGIGGTVPPEDAASVRRWQQIQIATGGLCLAAMAYGIVDAMVYHQSTRRLEADEKFLKMNKQSFLERPVIMPFASEDAAGLTVGWQF